MKTRTYKESLSLSFAEIFHEELELCHTPMLYAHNNAWSQYMVKGGHPRKQTLFGPIQKNTCNEVNDSLLCRVLKKTFLREHVDKQLYISLEQRPMDLVVRQQILQNDCLYWKLRGIVSYEQRPEQAYHRLFSLFSIISDLKVLIGYSKNPQQYIDDMNLKLIKLKEEGEMDEIILSCQMLCIIGEFPLQAEHEYIACAYHYYQLQSTIIEVDGIVSDIIRFEKIK